MVEKLYAVMLYHCLRNKKRYIKIEPYKAIKYKLSFLFAGFINLSDIIKEQLFLLENFRNQNSLKNIFKTHTHTYTILYKCKYLIQFVYLSFSLVKKISFSILYNYNWTGHLR